MFFSILFSMSIYCICIYKRLYTDHIKNLWLIMFNYKLIQIVNYKNKYNIILVSLMLHVQRKVNKEYSNY